MPEGHSVHRIARQFALHFVGRRVAASSPQGRFAAGAAQLDGHVMTEAMAVGKQMFLEFDNGLWLRVHLGIYGAWDFSGDITADATIASSNGRIGQTNQRGTVVGSFEDSLSSIGAPRRTRLRMAEQERLETPADTFPPEPIGAVRVRLLTDATCADLRGPTACDMLTPDEVQAVIAKLGPDPLVDTGRAAEDRFTATVLKKPTPICLLLMDQSVVSGIGNVYRAEMLFRARLNPHIPGRDLPEATVRALWKDWVKLLKIGVKTGQMMTMDGLSKSAYDGAMASRADRHWVYHRTGLPCRVCGTSIVMEEIGGRKLYWCPVCQA
ncbi:MAG TPA: zinc finger domain-containing protein [Rhodoglobus sp.]|nr:zinc finger domain-containing protein [Rhodoglobus sp.]